MPSMRLLTLIIGLCIILVLIIWLVSSLQQLYVQIAYLANNPFLANLLLLLLIGLMGVLVTVLIYYAVLFQRQSKRQRRPPTVSAVKTEAAQENLDAIRQQVSQIQDEVARQALLEQAQEIEAELNRHDLRVVIFGTGSAGKTSIVNALLGQVVGQVGAPMGTTTVGETYRFSLEDVKRAIWITDTPGIAEAGVAGTDREQLARQLATEADLLIFVVDSDLQKSEYQPLRSLAEIGKRSILVLNKMDLYRETDRDSILEQLRSRVRGLVPARDVVAVAANPGVVVLEAGERFQPDPDVMPLIRRMSAVLRAEGEDLIADNILLRSQRLSTQARQLIDAQRRRQAEAVVERFQWIGAGVVAATPIPLVDLLAAAAVNAQMVIEIGKVYGCDINMARGRELAISLAKTLVSLGIVRGATELLTTALEFSVGGFLVGRAIQGATAAYLTRIAGKSFIEYFRHDQDWGDGGITEVVQQQFQLNRRDAFIKAFVKDAIAKVTQPLSENTPRG